MTRTGYTPVALTQRAKVISGTINLLTANDSVGDDIDLIDMQSVSIQIDGTFTGTLEYQVQTRDGGPWLAKSLVTSGGTAASQTAGPVLVSGDIGARRLRVMRLSGTAGSANVEIVAWPMSQANQQSTQQVAGNVTTYIRPVTASSRLSNVNLAAGASFTQTAVDRGTDATTYDTRVRPVVRHLAGLTPGALILQESIDGTTWIETRRSPIPSDGLYHSFDWALHLRYWRLVFTNGATAQTGFDLLQQSSRGDGSSVDVRSMLSFVLTTTALAANGVYTGPTLDLGGNHDVSSVRALVRADQPGVAGGFQIRFSDDGTNWIAPQDGILNADSGTGARTISTEAKVQARYVRLDYTNGATAQGSMRAWLTLVSL